MFKGKKIAAWVLALAVPFGMSTSFSNQTFARKHDIYINVTSDDKMAKTESSSSSARIARRLLALLGIAIIITIIAKADYNSRNSGGNGISGSLGMFLSGMCLGTIFSELTS